MSWYKHYLKYGTDDYGFLDWLDDHGEKITKYALIGSLLAIIPLGVAFGISTREEKKMEHQRVERRIEKTLLDYDVNGDKRLDHLELNQYLMATDRGR